MDAKKKKESGKNEINPDIFGKFSGFLRSYFGKYVSSDEKAKKTDPTGGIPLRITKKNSRTGRSVQRSGSAASRGDALPAAGTLKNSAVLSPDGVTLLTDAENAPDKMNFILKGLAAALLTFVIGCASVFSGVRPLGTAFAAASGTVAPFSYIGLALSSVTAGDTALPVLVSCLTSLSLRFLLCRYLSSPDKPVAPFGESVPLRMLNACVSAVIAGLLVLFVHGFRLGDLFGMLIAGITAPAAVWIYAGVTERERRFTVHYEIAVMSVMVSAVWALRGASVLGFSLPTFAAMLLTLYVARTGGALRGGVTGILCGIACSPVYAPAFALAGLISGLLKPYGAVPSAAASGSVCVIYGLCAGGISSLLSFAPDILAAETLFLPLSQFGLLPKLLIYSSSTSVPEETLSGAVIGEKREKSNNERLKALSDSLSSLSGVFYHLSDRLRKPGIYETRKVCDEVWHEKCDRCNLNCVCWDKEFSRTSDILNKISEKIVKKGVLSADDIPEPLSGRCPHNERFVRKLNEKQARMLEEAAKRDRTEIFALDYEAMSRLLGEVCEQNSGEYEIDPELTRRARLAARRCGLYAQNIAVYGKRKIGLIAGGLDMSRMRLSSEEIRKTFGEACGMEFSAPEFGMDSEYVTMSLTRAPTVSVTTAFASNVKNGEKQNGDTLKTIGSREECFYMLISDGMGSGTEAALTSRTVAVFLEKMLEVGNRKSTVLEMLNQFIRNRNMECYATLDLLEVDLLTSKASFVKSGAANSYILRDGRLFKISSDSLPIGITRLINAEEIGFELKKDDIIVMMSDGVSQTLEDGIWLADLLTFGWEDGTTLDGMAQKILSGAKQHRGDKDDMTVGLVKIGERRYSEWLSTLSA